MKTIVYLVTEDWYFCSHRLSLALAAKQAGFEIVVITNPGDSIDLITANGLTVHPLTIPRSVGSPLQELTALINLMRLYRSIKPDLVHHISFKPVIFGSFAAWLTGVPRIVNAYTGLGYLFISESLLSRFFVSMVVPVMSAIMNSSRFYSIVQNSDDEQALLELGLVKPGRYSLIRGSGVDISLFDYSPESITDTPIVLFASRLLRDKGIAEFINAARTINAAGVPARFVVVGDIDKGNPTSISRSDIQAWSAEGHVEWWGYRQDMSDIFKQVHIVCLPSYREGLPKILLEAAACGRPIVTTDVPGCREVVENGVNGYLVAAKESVELADAISKLLLSPDSRNKMGAAGRRRVEEYFSLDRVNSATISLYETSCNHNISER